MNLPDSKSYCTLVVQTKTIHIIRPDANIKYMYKCHFHCLYVFMGKDGKCGKYMVLF